MDSEANTPHRAAEQVPVPRLLENDGAEELEGDAANAESFKSLEGLVSALDAMSPEGSAGARLRKEATIVIAGASRNNQSTFRKLFSMYFWPPGSRKTGAPEMTRLLRQKLEESLRRYLRKRSEITLAAGLTLSRMIQDDQVPS